jgi:iron complex outermembrane receptor protein
MLRSGWRTVGTLLVALLGTWQAPALAQTEAASTIAFDISDGTLLGAIKQFSEQTGIQVTADFGQPETQEHPVAALNESLTAEAALERILEGSGLVAKWHTSRTVRIYPVTAPRAFDGVNEVVVTGTRIGGASEGPAPVRVYTREDIDRMGVSSLSGVAEHFTQQPFSFGEWAQRSGAQHFQMRGLGVDTTLVLINGRRAPPSATSVSLNAFDLNSIPLTAVDRIEVMSDSASAIYGADAIGGVVNIILKKSVDSPDFFLHYGNAAGGARERRAAFSLGSSGERLKTALTVDYFERGMLIGAKRDLWRDQDFRRFGGTDWRATTANPGNVYSLTGEPLPGLTHPRASVPAGSTGVNLSPDDFLSTDGVLNLYSSLTTASVVPEFNRLSGFGTAEFSFHQASIFAELLLTSNDILFQGTLPSVTQQVVPADNPFNPFGQPVAVDYTFVGMDPASQLTESDLARFVLGARGELGRFDWELFLTKSDERVTISRKNSLNLERVRAALASTDQETALNLFADGPAGSESLLSSLVSNSPPFDYYTGGLQLSGFVRGDLFKLLGGSAQFVVGGEWRREEVRAFDSDVQLDLGKERDVASGFAEVKLPLLQDLSIKLAWRGDYYKNSYTSVNPQYGLVWRPARNWLVRAAYGTSFRPPSLPEESTPRFEYSLPIADPRRGGTISIVRVTGGGSRDLDNVSAHSFTSGLMYRPEDGSGLSFGAHYWHVAMDNRILLPRPSLIEQLEEVGRVTRLAPTESDRQAGWLGAVQSLDASILNYGRLETSGIDLDLSYRASGVLAGLKAELSATWVDKYVAQDFNPVQKPDRVGIASLDGTIPEWRLIGALTWEAKAWGATTTATFTPSYWDTDFSDILDRRVPARTTIDVHAWWDVDWMFESGRLEGLKLTVGARNLFDEDVNFANVGLGLGFDPSLADLRQRFVYLRVSKSL